MKINRLFILSILILSVFLAGCVSAEDAADNLTVNDSVADAKSGVRGLVEDEDYEIHIPCEISDPDVYGLDTVSVERMPGDAGGNITISVDDVERYNQKVSPGGNAISLADLNLAYGNHSIILNYSGDEKYSGFAKSSWFERTYLVIEGMEDLNGQDMAGDFNMEITLAEGVAGNVKILIDGKSVYDRKYDANSRPSVSLNDYIGYHTYEVRYSGGNQKDKIKKGSFNISAFYDIVCSEEVLYGDSAGLAMELNIKGMDVVAKINGRSYSTKSGSWYTYLDVPCLEIGENTIEVTVSWGESSQTKYIPVLVKPKVTVPTTMIAGRTYNLTFNASEDYNASLTLSGMADGTYKVTNGTAIVPISADAGNYTLTAEYGDYIEEFEISVLDMPSEVTIEFIGFSEVLYPWYIDFDMDPDHEEYLSCINVGAYPYEISGKTEIYLDGKLLETLSGEVSRYHVWPDYYDYGNHTITVAYLGDGTFNASSRSFTYEALPYQCYVDEYGVFNVRLMGDASGKLTVTCNGKKFTKTIKATDYEYDTHSISLDNVRGDANNTIEVEFKAKPAKYSFTDSFNFTSSLPIEFYGFEMDYGVDDRFFFMMPKDIKGKPAVTVDGKPYAFSKTSNPLEWMYFDEETQSVYVVKCSDLKPGVHEVVITYAGDSRYPQASINRTISISAAISSEDGIVSLALPAGAKGNLTVEIMKDGQEEYEQFMSASLSTGKASIKLPVGKYSFLAYYTGDDYDIENISYDESISPDVEFPFYMDYGQNEKFVSNDDVNATVVFYLGSQVGLRIPVYELDLSKTKSVSLNRIADEALKFARAKLMVNSNYREFGEYSLTLYPFIYSDVGDFDLYDAIEIYFNAKITGLSAVSMPYSASKTISMKLYDIYGKLVGKNQVVKIKIGKKTFNAKTNAKGVVSFKIPNMVTPGKYTITATYKNAKVSKKLTVKQILSLKTVKVKKSAKKLVLTATLKKVNKKYLKNKKITFKFNGKKYTAKTNKNGVAKVTIKKAVLKKLKVGKKITYQAIYLKDTVKKSVKVKK